MHFSIPDTQELYADLTGSTYTGYNIYINGNYHCCLRYKQLHALHEQLRRRCAELNIPMPAAAFPPKRLLPLTNGQLETRRAALEHYLQLCGQDAKISKMEQFQNFLLNAQQETAVAEGVLGGNEHTTSNGSGSTSRGNGNNGRDTFQRVNTIAVVLEVWLSNDCKLQVNCHIGDKSSCVLRTVCECIQLPTQFMQHFCLYLVRWHKNCRTSNAGAMGATRNQQQQMNNTNKLVLLRRLMDFESPYLTRLRIEESSHSAANANKAISRSPTSTATGCHIMLRKSYWNPMYDLGLLHDAIALKLLYAQTVADIENEWIIAPPDVQQKLENYRKSNLQKEYVQLARQLPLYGCLHFSACHIDYPEPRTTALIAIGNRELSMRTIGKGGKMYETKFRVTRMRCWRVTAVHNAQLGNSNNGDGNMEQSTSTSTTTTTTTTIRSSTNDSYSNTPTNLELAFEYLLSKQNLRWITITSSQAMLMSVSLQSMVDELLNCKDAVDGLTARIHLMDISTTNSGHGKLLSYVSRNGRVSHSAPSMLTASVSTPSLSTQLLMSSPSPSSSTSASAVAGGGNMMNAAVIATTPNTSTSSAASSSSSSAISGTTASSQAPVKFLSQRTRLKSNPKCAGSSSYSAVFFRNNGAMDSSSVHNEAFEGIGDDDL